MIVIANHQSNSPLSVIRTEPDSYCFAGLVGGWHLNDNGGRVPAQFVNEVPTMFYETITVGNFEFPITSDGLILEQRDYPDSIEWSDSIPAAQHVADELLPIIHLIESLPGPGFFDQLQPKDIDAILDQCLVLHSWLWDASEIGAKSIKLPSLITGIVDMVARKHKPRQTPRMQDEQRKITGYVYLTQSPSGLYKIGKTKDPQNRLRTFGVKLPFEIEMIHVIPCRDYHDAEIRLHEKFADKRMNGSEFFALTGLDVELIKSIQWM